MAFTSKTYTIKGADFRVLNKTDKKEIWVQHIPTYAMVGFISTADLYTGKETMADFIVRFKAWINEAFNQWFSKSTTVPDPKPPVIDTDPIDKQIDDLIVNLLIVNDKVV